MLTKTRIGGIFGVILLVTGGTAVAWGSYQQTANPCESGYQISTERVKTNETLDSRYERIAFTDLSTVEQRIFLESITDMYNQSNMYQDSSELANLSDKAITYRSDQYVTHVVVSDCAGQPGTYSKLGGGITAFIGLGSLILTGIWQQLT